MHILVVHKQKSLQKMQIPIVKPIFLKNVCKYMHFQNWHFFFIANFKNAYTSRTQTKKFAKNTDTNRKTNFSKKSL